MRRVLVYVKKIIQYIAFDMKVSHKLIVMVVILVAIPLLALSMLFFNMFQGIVREEVMASHEQVVDQYIENANYKLTIYQNLLENISVNRTILDIYSRQDQLTQEDMYEVSRKVSGEIQSLLINQVRSSIYSIVIYALAPGFPTDGNNLGNLSRIGKEDWYGEIGRVPGPSVFLTKSKVFGSDMVCITRPLTAMQDSSFLKNLGLIKVDIKGEELFSLRSHRLGDRFDAVVFLNARGERVMNWDEKGVSQETLRDGSILSVIRREKNGRLMLGMGRNRGILIYRHLDRYHLTGLFFVPYREINRKLVETGLFLLFWILMLLGIFIGLTVLFSKLFTKRISFLVAKMQGIQAGNLEIGGRLEGKDEIAMLDANFNRMVERLRQLISENYIQQIKKRDAQLEALQFQINPHFLYNTLESMNVMAAQKGFQEFAIVCQRLGDMFRYNINVNRTEVILLSEEIQQIDNYLFIQKVRFAERIELFYDIPARYHKARILKFILQPLVENAVYHGLQDKKGRGCIEIACSDSQGTLFIVVRDDGQGMEEEQVREIGSYLGAEEDFLENLTKQSIGLRNVNARIRLAYGSCYGVSLESVKGSGTAVTLRLPLHY